MKTILMKLFTYICDWISYYTNVSLTTLPVEDNARDNKCYSNKSIGTDNKVSSGGKTKTKFTSTDDIDDKNNNYCTKSTNPIYNYYCYDQRVYKYVI